ncbi:MAG TPA: hypothetical protein VNF93_02490 [Buchnera sp. (in: enterobacteria)]|nr:hypothetical protein [Buchnera sp. (in: enterobacteria)]
MQLDLTMIKNETLLNFGKSLIKIKSKFEDMLNIALDSATKEINSDKRKEVEIVLNDMLNDEMSKYNLQFISCMNKCTNLIESSLNC